jgi:hypothetical protein
MESEYESDALDAFQESEAYDTQEVDAMLDSMMEEADSEFAEARRGRRHQPQRRGVPTAKGGSAYRAPTEDGYVTQKQFKEALSRVGDETRRNAEGIKTVNARMGKLDSQVSDVVTVAKTHSKRINTLDTRMKLDGALDFATSFTLVQGTAAVGSTPAVPASLSLDASQLLRGVVKNGLLGDGKGALSNPWLVGGIGMLLKNPGIVGGLLTQK